MINLEIPKKHAQLIDQAHQLAMNMLRPISRKYDRAEHEYPKELDMLAALIDGVSETGATGGAGADHPGPGRGDRTGRGAICGRRPRLWTTAHLVRTEEIGGTPKRPMG